jgi:hypothetical protein
MACLVTPGSPVMAQQPWDLVGLKSVKLITADGGTQTVGTVEFTPQGAGTASFKLVMSSPPLTDFFLSMREFKCLAAAQELSCHVPYPYANPGTVSSGNLAWLEHSLLFFFKAPADYGAKLFNGMYFEFRRDGARLVGTPMAVDLNAIAAPPKDLGAPAFTRGDRHELAVSRRWVQAIHIE